MLRYLFCRRFWKYPFRLPTDCCNFRIAKWKYFGFRYWSRHCLNYYDFLVTCAEFWWLYDEIRVCEGLVTLSLSLADDVLEVVLTSLEDLILKLLNFIGENVRGQDGVNNSIDYRVNEFCLRRDQLCFLKRMCIRRSLFCGVILSLNPYQWCIH